MPTPLTNPPAPTPLALPLLLTLALTMMLGPFAVDTYLPAFPVIANTLAVDQQSIAATVSVFIFSLACGQLVGGALSDRYGRKPILISGLLLASGAALMQAYADSLAVLSVGRGLQAFGAGWALVSVPALVRDRVEGQQAAKLFSLLGLIMVVAPAIAPSAGSALLKLGSWRVIFLFLAGYSVLLIPLIALTLDTKPTPTAPPANSESLLDSYRAVFRTRQALPFIAWQSGSFSVMMLFITHSSFIYQLHFKQSADMFALLFAANIIAMFSFNLTNRLLLSRLSSLTVLRLATLCQGAGLALLLAATLLSWPLPVFLGAMMITVGALGAITPNIQACYLDYFGSHSGTASALLGASQFGIAGLASGLSALLPANLLLMVLSMAACGAVGLVLTVRSLRHPHGPT